MIKYTAALFLQEADFLAMPLLPNKNLQKENTDQYKLKVCEALSIPILTSKHQNKKK